jgi:hypothetical protein
MLLQHLPGMADPSERLEIEQSIASELTQYITKHGIVHGIARVVRGLDQHDEDTVKTVVIWKNVFVGDRLPPDFDDESFGIAYDNTYEF